MPSLPSPSQTARAAPQRQSVAITAFAALLASLLALFIPRDVHAADEPAASNSGERVQVSDPFIELRTGPGRGYPVFFVAEKAAWITIELRHTDWFRVRTESAQGGRVGWVHRAQIERTLTEAGSGKTLRDVLVDDYLHRRVEAGAGWGRMRSEPMIKLWVTVRLGETLAAEFTSGQVQGTFAGTDLWHLSLVSEPWSHQRLSPFFSVGLGRIRNLPNPSLVGASTTNANLGHAGLGLRWYLSERFVARVDWATYAAFVSDSRTLEYRAVTAGLSFFF